MYWAACLVCLSLLSAYHVWTCCLTA
jgi:hypothetical protein